MALKLTSLLQHPALLWLAGCCFFIFPPAQAQLPDSVPYSAHAVRYAYHRGDVYVRQIVIDKHLLRVRDGRVDTLDFTHLFPGACDRIREMVPTPMGLVVVGLQLSKAYNAFYLLTPADTLLELARMSWFTGGARTCISVPLEIPNYCPSVYNPIDTAIYMPQIKCGNYFTNYYEPSHYYKKLPLYRRVHLESNPNSDFVGEADPVYYTDVRFMRYRHQWHSVAVASEWATGFAGTHRIHLSQPGGATKIFGEPGQNALAYFDPQPLRWHRLPPWGYKRRLLQFERDERRLNHWSNTYSTVLYDSTHNLILRQYSAFPDTLTSTRQHYLQVYNAADLSYVREIPLGPRVYQLFWAEGALMLIRAPEDEEGTVASVERVEF